MKKDRVFVKQLENLRQEANIIASYVYAEMTIRHAASQSRTLLYRLNESPTFWQVSLAALQSSAYIALGRVFDTTSSRYCLYELLSSLEESLDLFSKEALSQRKRKDGFTDEKRLAEYLGDAHQFSTSDLRSLIKSVAHHKKIYEKAVMLARHNHLAHRSTFSRVDVQNLYARGKEKDMWRLSTYLLNLYEQLWNLYTNGRKPNLRLPRYSPKAMFERPLGGAAAHERMVGETQKLMLFLETARLPH